ncbi:MAG TPA: CHAT domain-containing protein, partial [Polyangiaceae bacterium]
LDLWGTRLVVLSACDTGIGEVKNGEGVYGLRRALSLAGAQSLVMSLWKVNDFATRDLMTAYYARLAQGAGRAAGLRDVQLRMSRTGDYAHPYYWASFVALGADGPLGAQTALPPALAGVQTGFAPPRVPPLRAGGGCGCRVAEPPRAADHGLELAILLGRLVIARRRRARRPAVVRSSGMCFLFTRPA